MRKKNDRARLIYAATSQSADLFYATRFKVPDAVVWFEWRGKTHLILSPLEVDRGRKSATVDCVLSLAELSDEFQNESGQKNLPPIEELVVFIFRQYGIKSVEVPPEFPLFMADQLRQSHIEVVVSAPFYPQRRKKTASEIELITKGQRQAEVGLKRGLEIMTHSSVRRDRKLSWGGKVLTSERLRFEIEQAVRLAGGVPDHTIVAGGIQSCDPHEAGHGPLLAGETIILDIFPYDQNSGYFGDLTRTVVKGQATDAQRHLYQTVKTNQRLAMDAVRAGLDGARLQQKVKAAFHDAGYPTELQNERWVGFFHGLGHGLGLDIHESPRIAAGKLRVGDVITVEPGLYYPEIGGVRLENVLVVEKSGSLNLTKAAYRFEIP